MQTVGNKEKRVCLMLTRTAGRCGQTGTVFCSVLCRRTASRTSQGLAELARDNKKVNPQSTSRELVHLLVLFFACSPICSNPFTLLQKEEEGKKRMIGEEWNPYTKHYILLLNSVLLLRANKQKKSIVLSVEYQMFR